MARKRFLKPEFFIHEQLAKMPPLARLLFSGLWCLADREGRLEDRPERIKIQLLPWDNCDVDALLNRLAKGGHIVRYEVDKRRFIEVSSFLAHQSPHVREAPSIIPPSSSGKKHRLGNVEASPRSPDPDPDPDPDRDILPSSVGQPQLALPGAVGESSTASPFGVTNEEPKQEALPEEAVLWNEVASEDFGKVVAMNETRRKKIRALRKTLPDLDAWRRAMLRLNSWPWAHGQNDTGWKAGFDYLLSNDKHGNSNLIALSEGAKGGEKVQDVRRGFQSADDYWERLEAEKANGSAK